MLPLAWVLVGVAAALNGGAYWTAGVVLIALATGAVYWPTGRGRPDPARGELALWSATLFAALFSPLATLVLRAPLHLAAAWAERWIFAAQVALVAGVIVYARPVRLALPPRARRAHFLATVAAGALSALLAIRSAPDPGIDVFYFLNEGARGLLGGQNPYAMQFTPLPASLSPGYQDPAYHFDVYGYLPGMLLLSLPTVPLGDVRWLMWLSALLAVLLLRSLGARQGLSEEAAELLAIAALAYPGLLWVLQHAWVEPVLVALWLGTLRLALARNASAPAALLAGLALSIKQFNPPLLIPLAAGLGRRGLLASLAVPATLCLLFLAWSPRDFLWDTLGYHLQIPPRPDALSLVGLALDRFGAAPPGWISLAAPAAVLVHAGRVAARQRGDIAIALRLTAGFYLVLFLFNRAAFANYYFLCAMLLLAATGASLAPRPALVAEPAAPAPEPRPLSLLAAEPTRASSR